MVRKASQERLRDFLQTASRLFIARGYRRTQMSDVTEALGLSAGAIYRYVASKEALFDLTLRYAIDPDLRLDEILLPSPTPAREATLGYLRREIESRARIETLHDALDCVAPGDPRAELEGIAREMFAKLARYKQALTLVERCALDWPELAVLWFEESRRGVIEGVAEYFRRRGEQGALRRVPDAEAAAVLFVQVVFYQAVGRHEDPYLTPTDDATAEAVARDNLIHAYLGPAFRSPVGPTTNEGSSR